MKKTMFIRRLLLAFAVICVAGMSSKSWAQFTWKYNIINGKAVTEIPTKPTDQQSALNLTAPKLPVIHIAFVGLGMRGPDAVERWTHIPGIQVMALCDYERDRAEKCQQILRKASMPAADIYSGEEGYKALCKRKDIDLVYIATDWHHHFLVAKEAMNNGKHVAIEVPAAMNMSEIWQLINLSEQKQLHCMMLENCCYDFFELNSLNMAQKGLFGEVLYVQGAYRHDLSPFWNAYWKRDSTDKMGWRLDYNQKHRGDIYATHGLGPIAQVLNIHRGDRMKTLVAMDTKSVNGKWHAQQMTGEKCNDFKNGDQTTTLIRTENGKVIEIQHNVMTPQPYNRMYQLTGTKGFANKYPIEGYALAAADLVKSGITPSADDLSGHSYLSAKDAQALTKKFESPILTRYEQEAKEVGGHGGMDFIMDARLAYCLHNGLPLDIDVYDLAEWCCLAELGAISMDNGNIPVEVPDFTRGEWQRNKGFKHAYASPAEEEETRRVAQEFTQKLKERGKVYWEKFDKKKKR